MELTNPFLGKVSKTSWINPKSILKYVSEEDIFKLVFDTIPEEFEYITSPFREDLNPSCWFERSLVNGKLMFVDFATKTYLNGIRLIRIDCFDAVRIYYNLKSFPETLEFIRDRLIKGKKLQKRDPEEKRATAENCETIIRVAPRAFLLSDYNYWYKRYHITKENLISDKVFPVEAFKIESRKSSGNVAYPADLTYCFSDFEGGRKKLYRPFKEGKGRFISNCTQNDVGGRGNNDFRRLIITKSYKDYRVLKNQGLNVRWIQGETIFPEPKILLPLCYNYKEVIILFDNDSTGIKWSENLVKIINSYLTGRARRIFIPTNLDESNNIKDPADLIHHLGRKALIEFLAYHRVLY